MRHWAIALGLLAVICVLTASAAEMQVEDVAFVAQCDQSTQRYVLVTPEGFRPGASQPILVALHGHGSDRWQFVRHPRDECRAARDAATARRMLFVAPDYRARTSWMGPQAEADLLQILDELRTRYRIGKVILCGGSMGATAALTFAVLHPERVDGVVAMNGTANLLEFDGFPEALRESFGGTKAEVPAEYRRRSAEFQPERLTMPIGLTTGGADHVVPAASVLRLADRLEKLHANVLLIHRPQGGHSTDYADAKWVLEFVLDRAIGRNIEAIPAATSPQRRTSENRQ